MRPESPGASRNFAQSAPAAVWTTLGLRLHRACPPPAVSLQRCSEWPGQVSGSLTGEEVSAQESSVSVSGAVSAETEPQITRQGGCSFRRHLLRVAEGFAPPAARPHVPFPLIAITAQASVFSTAPPMSVFFCFCSFSINTLL